MDTVQTDSNKKKILDDLSRLITTTKEYFVRSNNELAKQYLENLNLFITNAREVKLNPKNSEDESKLRAEAEAKEKIIEKGIYLDFLIRISKLSGGDKSVALKILIQNAEDFKKELMQASEDSKGEVLGKMQFHGRQSARFFTEFKSQFGIAYFEKFNLQIEMQVEKWSADFEKHNQESFVASQNLGKQSAESIETYQFQRQLEGFIWGAGELTLPNRSWVTTFKGTQVKFTFKDIDLEKSSGNISSLALSPKTKRIYTIEILAASSEVREVLHIAAETLLKHPKVYGVYFENQLKIPASLSKNKYEISGLGRGRVLVRPRALTCSALFS